MSRDISTVLAQAIEQQVVYPFFAIELLFDNDQTLRMWTGLGELSYNSLIWYGAGNLLTIEAIEETSETAARGATVTLSAIPTEVVSLALSEPYQGRKATIYFGAHVEGQLDSASMTEVFSGYMDQMSIEEGPTNSSIQLSIENKLIDLERPRTARFTSAYQKSLYPDDLGLDFVEDLQTKQISWGR